MGTRVGIEVNKPRMATVGPARTAQNTHRAELISCLKKLYVGIYLFEPDDWGRFAKFYPKVDTVQKFLDIARFLV